MTNFDEVKRIKENYKKEEIPNPNCVSIGIWDFFYLEI